MKKSHVPWAETTRANPWEIMHSLTSPVGDLYLESNASADATWLPAIWAAPEAVVIRIQGIFSHNFGVH